METNQNTNPQTESEFLQEIRSDLNSLDERSTTFKETIEEWEMDNNQLASEELEELKDSLDDLCEKITSIQEKEGWI